MELLGFTPAGEEVLPEGSGAPATADKSASAADAVPQGSLRKQQMSWEVRKPRAAFSSLQLQLTAVFSGHLKQSCQDRVVLGSGRPRALPQDDPVRPDRHLA